MKRLKSIMFKMFSLILICIFLTLSCSSNKEEGTNSENSITFEDLAGRTVTLKTPIKKMILIRSRDIYEFAAVLGEDLPQYITAWGPDIIYITAAFWPQTIGAVRCGYYADKKTSNSLLNAYLTRPGWNTLKAVKEKKVYSLFHGFTMHIYSFSALQHMAKALYPDVFSDLDPEANFIKFHNTFFPVAYSGVWMTELKRENEEEI